MDHTLPITPDRKGLIEYLAKSLPTYTIEEASILLPYIERNFCLTVDESNLLEVLLQDRLENEENA